MDLFTTAKLLGGVIIVLLVFSMVQKNIKPSSREIKSTSTESETFSQISPSPTPIPTNIPYVERDSTQQQVPSSTPSPIPTISQSNSSVSIDTLIYPNSKQIKKDGNNITLESNESAQTVTDWYKEKIKSLGMNAKSFVQTSTNGTILNKLAGSDGKTEVNVEISKQKDQVHVTIMVSVEVENSSSSSVRISI